MKSFLSNFQLCLLCVDKDTKVFEKNIDALPTSKACRTNTDKKRECLPVYLRNTNNYASKEPGFQ